MTCDERDDLTAEALADSLTGAAQVAFEAHLAACPACRGEWEGLRELRDLLRELPEPVPAPEAPAPVPCPRPVDPDAGLRGWAVPFLLGAASMLLLVGGVALGMGMRGRTVPADPVLALLEQASPARRQQGLMLVRQREATEPGLAPMLLKLVATDRDLGVRLAAVEALGLWAGAPEFREDLVQAVATQDRPEVQAALVDLLLAQQERQALEALRRLQAEGRLQAPARVRLGQVGC